MIFGFSKYRQFQVRTLNPKNLHMVISYEVFLFNTNFFYPYLFDQ